MAMEEQSLGLCSTCNNKETCIRRKNIKFPVLYCEEFDDFDYSISVRSKWSMASATLKEEDALDISMGLCCNCGNRDSCTLRRTPGGIWHCEEYC